MAYRLSCRGSGLWTLSLDLGGLGASDKIIGGLKFHVRAGGLGFRVLENMVGSIWQPVNPAGCWQWWWGLIVSSLGLWDVICTHCSSLIQMGNNLCQIGPTWPICSKLNQSDSIVPLWCQRLPMFAKIHQCGPNVLTLVQLGTNWFTLAQIGPHWPNMSQFGTHRSMLCPFDPIWAIFAQVAPFWYIWP